MNKSLASILAAGLLLSAHLTVSALGFGSLNSKVVLGQLLNITVPVLAKQGELIDENCLAADVFFGDDKLPSTAVTASISTLKDGQQLVNVRTNSRIYEPFFTVNLTAGCKDKVSKKIVGFADLPKTEVIKPTTVPASAVSEKPLLQKSTPPTLAAAVKAQERLPLVEMVQVPEGQTIGQSSSVIDLAEKLASRGNSLKPLERQSSKQALSKATQKSTKSSKPTKRVEAPIPVSNEPAPRLELEPVAGGDVFVESLPSLRVTNSMVLPQDSEDANTIQKRRAEAAALWAAMNASPEQVALEFQRVQNLERQLKELQSKTMASNNELGQSKATSKDASFWRNPLVIGLIGICVLLLSALAGLFWRQKKQENNPAAWWQSSHLGGQNASHPESTLSGGLSNSYVVADSAADAADSANSYMSENKDQLTQPAALIITPTSKTQAKDEQADSGFLSLSIAGFESRSSGKTNNLLVKREMSVDELIDLEQQADFFVVLGQDNSAIELLESHIYAVTEGESNAGAFGPLPFLKLLEIYQRLGQRENYDRLQQLFNQRFNAYAPAWESDLQQGYTLQDYPDVLTRLQALWYSPEKSMDVLQQSLIKPEETHETFDLPAYRDLLLLYSIARDLSEQQSKENNQVDIDVPDLALDFDEDGPDTSISPLIATHSLKGEGKVKRDMVNLDFGLKDALTEKKN